MVGHRLQLMVSEYLLATGFDRMAIWPPQLFFARSAAEPVLAENKAGSKSLPPF